MLWRAFSPWRRRGFRRIAHVTRITVPEGEPRTLAVIVREALGVGHRRAKELVATGRVVVDGVAEVRAGARPAAGARIEVRERPSTDPQVARAVHGPGFRVVHLDDAFVAVDKDPGVLVIPTSAPDPTDPPLVARVMAALRLAGHRARELWVVHRIDRETSGLVLFARTPAAYEALRQQFRARSPEREYVAFTEGVPIPASGELRGWLSEETRAARRVRSVPEHVRGALLALLRYDVEATRATPPRARVRVRLVTGRRNQIRVQFSSKGCPLLGDRFYGATDPGPGRTALHAARLAFAHPIDGSRIELVAALPRDLATLDRTLFRR